MRSGIIGASVETKLKAGADLWDSIRLRQSPVAKVAVAGALHDGLRARELYVGTKSLGRSEVRTADQQESELRLT